MSRTPTRTRARARALFFLLLCLVLLAACGATGGASALEYIAQSPSASRPGLGTTFGESRFDPIHHVSFIRASDTPIATALLHYDDAAGVAAHAEYLGVDPEPLALQPFGGSDAVSIALVDARGRTLPGFTAAGRTLVIGERGERYSIVVHDATPARFEIVSSVDGLDVIDGEPATRASRGYIVAPGGTLVIEGFRTSETDVAAFRFGSVAESYAAQTSPRGDRDVGVIGVAIFAERGAAWTPDDAELRDTAEPFPGERYARPPG